MIFINDTVSNLDVKIGLNLKKNKTEYFKYELNS